MSFDFILESALLGVGLAMDAFSVSLANGLREPRMGLGRMSKIAGIYAFFQYLMPLLGWVCVHTVVEAFSSLERFIPWIALGLLGWIGGKMLLEGLRERKSEAPVEKKGPGIRELLIQGVATSIDALSVGFTIAQYQAAMALAASLIIAVVTFGICMGGAFIGKKVGAHLSGKASILGGTILIAIGLEILIKSFIA